MKNSVNIFKKHFDKYIESINNTEHMNEYYFHNDCIVKYRFIYPIEKKIPIHLELLLFELRKIKIKIKNK